MQCISTVYVPPATPRPVLAGRPGCPACPGGIRPRAGVELRPGVEPEGVDGI